MTVLKCPALFLSTAKYRKWEILLDFMVKNRRWRTSKPPAGLGYCILLISGHCQVRKNKWEMKWCLVAPTRFCKYQWVGAESSKALIFKNLHLLAKIQLSLAEKCGGKGLICGVPMVISDTYSSSARLQEEHMGTDFFFFNLEASVFKYFIVLKNTRGCVWNRKPL